MTTKKKQPTDPNDEEGMRFLQDFILRHFGPLDENSPPMLTALRHEHEPIPEDLLQPAPKPPDPPQPPASEKKPAPAPAPPPEPDPLDAVSAEGLEVVMPQPGPGRVLHNTDPESHLRWAKIDKLMATGEWTAEKALPPEAEGVNGTTPERTMVERYGRRYPHTIWVDGQFFRWAAGRWHPVSPDQFQREIHAIVDHAIAQGNVPRGSLKRLPQLIAERVRVKLATEPLAPPPPNSLPLANGLLNLTTGTISPVSETNFVGNALPYAYDPAARCPVWDAFLQSRVPEFADFLQEFAGYCLTTDTRHELALWLYGRPGAGKSTFLRGLQVLLGPRAGLLKPDRLLSGRFSPAEVKDKSLLVCAEPPQLNLGKVERFNAFVSGEALTVEPKYGQAQLIQPCAKLAWAFTALPFVPDADSPLFRRVAVIPFPPPLPQDQQDADLKLHLEAEAPGLLNWALQGLHRLAARGRFIQPPGMVAASQAFQADNDLAAHFLAERCELGAEFKVQAQRLREAYAAWRQVGGLPRPHNNLIARDWERLGLQRRRHEGRHYWFGVRLRGV